jgi:deoxyhypusine synthase
MTDDGPPREEFEPDPLEHVRVRPGMTVGELAAQYGRGGIGARDVHEAVECTAEMFGDDDVTTFMGLAGAMVPGGMRQLVTDLLRDGHVDALVTTGANLTHDAIEAIGGHHHHGREDAPDRTAREHDEQLRTEGGDRIYDVYLPQEHFAAFEDHLRESVFPAFKGTVSIRGFTAELGRANAAVNDREDVAADPGVAAAAYETDVPVYCAAIQDSVLGLQAWMYSQVSPFSLDALADMTELNDLAHEAGRAGAIPGSPLIPSRTLTTALARPSSETNSRMETVRSTSGKTSSRRCASKSAKCSWWR